MNQLLSSLSVPILLSTALSASAAHYVIDGVHSQIHFSVSHLGFSTSNGTFNDFEGTFEFDENDIENSSVEVAIRTNSVDMNDPTWSSHLTGAQWFFAARFPTMTFKSSSVKSTGEDTLDVMGVLTLLDEPRPVTLNVTINKVGDSNGKQTAGFSATTTIDRTEFGMETFAGFIGSEVSIRLEVEGSPPEED